MISNGADVKRAREGRGWSQRRLWMRICAVFDEPISLRTIEELERRPDRRPQARVRKQLEMFLRALDEVSR